MIPNAQKRKRIEKLRKTSFLSDIQLTELGDPVEDLAVATVLMMVGGKLALLKPQKTGSQEVKYDMQILADRIEFCWIHLRGIGTLENSLWAYDGRGIRVWLNALNLESRVVNYVPNTVQESVNIRLDFYPLCMFSDSYFLYFP